MADYEYDAELDLDGIGKDINKIDADMQELADTGTRAFERIESGAKKSSDEMRKFSKRIASSSAEAKKFNTVWRDANGRLRDANGRFVTAGRAAEILGRKVEDAGRKGRQGFGGIGREAQLSGTQIGLVSGVTSALTQRLVELGAAGVRALVDIGKQSVETASNFEVINTALLGIFNGSQEAADATFSRIRERSIELGVDLTELAGAFLPRVESVDQFERIAEISTALARFQPEQGAVGSRIALIEALSGDFISLRRRFELSTDEINVIKQYQEELGTTEGLIAGLENVLEGLGRNLGNLEGTFATSLGRGQQIALELQSIFGEPILDGLKETLDSLFEAFQNNQDDFETVAAIFGTLTANILDLVKSKFIENLEGLDIKQVEELAGSMSDAANAAFDLADQLFDLDITNLLEQATDFFDLLEQGFDLISTEERRQRAQSAKLQALQKALEESGNPIVGITVGSLPEIEGIESPFEALIEAVLSEEEANRILQAGEKAYQAVIDESNQKVEEAKQRRRKDREEIEKVSETIQNTNAEPIDTSTADAILAQKDALRDEAAAAEDAAAANEKLSEALDKIDTGKARAEADALTKSLQSLADEELKASQTREKNLRDFDRKIRELQIDAADEREKKSLQIQQDAAEAKIKIERDYQREIQKINRETNRLISDAALERDAIAFFEAIKNQERAQEDARSQRDEATQEAETEREKQERELGEIDEGLQEKIERERRYLADRQQEADIANEQRQAKIQLDYERELERINLNEQRKLEDFRTRYDEQIALLEEYLGQELDLRTITEQEITAMIEAESEKRRAAIDAEIETRERLAAIQTERESGGRTRTSSGRDVSGGIGGIPEFNTGGVVAGPRGSRQLIIAHAGETILPTHEQPIRLPQSPSISSITNASRNFSVQGDLNFGSGMNSLDRFVTKDEFLSFIRAAGLG